MARARSIGLLLALFCTFTAQSVCISNPMMQGQDPAVTLYNGVYHLVQSDGCNIHLRRSQTLAGLPVAVDTIIFSPGCSDVWAPELHWLNNHWYLYYSRDPGTGHRVYVAESQGTSPYGPYTSRGVLFNGFWNIDGNVFTYGGQLYFICSGNEGSSQNLYIAPMSNPYTLSGSLVLISEPDQPWERNGLVNEGPWGFQYNGRLFIVYSASGCWTDDYTLGLLTFTGTNLLQRSAWTKSGPMFTKQPGAYGPGHNCVLPDAAGQWWNIYHANNNSGEGCQGFRKIRAQRIWWDLGGMPSFGTPVPVGSLLDESTNFLAARFALTETTGTNAASGSCGPPAVLMGAPVWQNPGLKLNGTGDYVNCGAALGNDVQHALTLAAWIKPDAFTDWAGIITKGTTNSPYAMQIWNDGSLRFTANWGPPPGSSGSGSWNSNTKMSVGQWYHVAITYDGINVRFYINGTLDSNAPAISLRFGTANESLVLGADFPGGDEYFKGTIRDARLYGRALSQAEIQALAAINHPPSLSPIADRTIMAGTALTITNSATDPDVPPQTLTFSLLSGPAGVSMNASSGKLSWRPSISQSPSTNPIAISVSDNGTPSLAATQSFSITVLRPAAPVLSAVAFNSNGFEFSVGGDVGPDYLLFSATNLFDASWSLLVSTNPLALPFLFRDPVGINEPQRFYRVLLGP